MAAEALLERLPEGRRPRVMRIEGELGRPGGGRAYEALLREELGNHPRLDLALLGLGPDGHTASLFPGKPAVEEHRRLAVGVPEPGLDPRVPRVTLTLPVFNAAREVVFLISGADKAHAVARAFGDPRTESRRPRTCARAPGRSWSCSTPRPPRSSSDERRHFVGLDVGGTKVASATLEDGRLSEASMEPTDLSGTEPLLDQLAAPSSAIAGAHARGRHRRAVGDRVRDRPGAPLGQPAAAERAAAQAPDRPHRPAGLRRERRVVRGDGRGPRRRGRLVCPHLIMFTVGTGVGGGFVLNGRLYRGATGAARRSATR